VSSTETITGRQSREPWSSPKATRDPSLAAIESIAFRDQVQEDLLHLKLDPLFARGSCSCSSAWD